MKTKFWESHDENPRCGARWIHDRISDIIQFFTPTFCVQQKDPLPEGLSEKKFFSLDAGRVWRIAGKSVLTILRRPLYALFFNIIWFVSIPAPEPRKKRGINIENWKIADRSTRWFSRGIHTITTMKYANRRISAVVTRIYYESHPRFFRQFSNRHRLIAQRCAKNV